MHLHTATWATYDGIVKSWELKLPLNISFRYSRLIPRLHPYAVHSTHLAKVKRNWFWLMYTKLFVAPRLHARRK